MCVCIYVIRYPYWVLTILFPVKFILYDEGTDTQIFIRTGVFYIVI